MKPLSTWSPSVLLFLVACGSGGGGDTGGSGGSGASGGAPSGTGGTSAATGGSTASGGAPSSGGAAPSSGGAASDGSGGVVGSGGAAQPVDCSGITTAGHELCMASETTCEAVFTNGAGCTDVCAAAGLSCVSALENVDGECAGDAALPALGCDSGHQSDFCVCGGPGSGTGGAPGTGGSAGSGGVGSGGAASGGAGSGGSDSGPGQISLTDSVPGFASVEGGTTGGGTDLASALVVSTMDELQDAAEDAGAAIILVEPGTYAGTLRVTSDKTIVGVEPGVLIQGNISISGDDVSNVIVRNLAVRGNHCETYDECRAGADAVYMGNGAHHIWLDHLDISDGQDGNCDATQGADYITVSWTKFYYTYDKEHRFSNLIAGSDSEPDSVGKLHITYMNSHWGERVDTRQPRGRFGNIHMLNNYHNTGGGQIHGVGKDMALIAENCFYDEDGQTIWTDMGSPRGWKGVGNEGTGSDLNATRGSVFTIPYSYTALPASAVVDAVTALECGAGNTCDLQR